MTGIHYINARGPDGMRIYAIGDVHGRRDLLEKMFRQIDAQIALKRPADHRIILLGDYVDRGPDSKGVLDLIIARKKADPRVIALGGNHDFGFLQFLETPTDAYLFTEYGGSETALSYGIKTDFSAHHLMLGARDALLRAMPPAHVDFLASMPRSVSFGDFFFCHAGIRPGVPLDNQNPDDLIWIRGDFLYHEGLHPKVIVHGHTPADTPEVLANRVNVDTRAYETGMLTALVINGPDKDMLVAEDWNL